MPRLYYFDHVTIYVTCSLSFLCSVIRSHRCPIWVVCVYICRAKVFRERFGQDLASTRPKLSQRRDVVRLISFVPTAFLLLDLEGAWSLIGFIPTVFQLLDLELAGPRVHPFVGYGRNLRKSHIQRPIASQGIPELWWANPLNTYRVPPTYGFL